MNCNRYDLEIQQGSTWLRTLAYLINDEPVNIESYAARMQVRKSYDLPAVVSISTDNGIVIDDVNKINLQLSAEATAELIAGRYLYDIEIDDAGTVERIISGILTVSAEVTK